MADKLPDELIKNILTPGLAVSDDKFTSKDISSFFRYDNPSSSVVLEVCKQWLRIATPLLYHTVVVRTKAQSNALEYTLRANKPLGLFVKKLRLEGGYGVSMGTILLATPNVTDVFLSLKILSKDNVSGLCRSLSSLDPVRVIIHDSDDEKLNRAFEQVVAQLCECIPEWKRMVCGFFITGLNVLMYHHLRKYSTPHIPH